MTFISSCLGTSLVVQAVKNLPAMQEIHIRPPGEGNGYTLQYSCLENSMDRGACQATDYGVAESDMTERLMLSLSLIRSKIQQLEFISDQVTNSD